MLTALLTQNLKVSSKNSKTNKQQTQPSSTTASSTSETKSSDGSSSSQQKKPLFPRYAWFVAFIAYHARRFLKKRRAYEEDWFVKSIDTKLEHYGIREYEDDFLSVDGSFYGSTSKWSGEELNKFDL